MTLANNRNDLRAQIAQMTEEFLANGGVIQKIPTGKRVLTASVDLTSNEKVSGEVK